MADFTYDKLDKEVTQGNDREIKFIFDTDVSSFGVFYTASKNFTETDLEADITVNTAEVLFTDSGVGYTDTITIPLSSVNTNIEPGKYLHDVKIINASGKIQTLAKGVLTILGQQTKRTS